MISVRVHEIRMILENVAAQIEPAESATVPKDFGPWSASDAIPAQRGHLNASGGWRFRKRFQRLSSRGRRSNRRFQPARRSEVFEIIGVRGDGRFLG
jgi:hypothetical protein